MSTVPLARFLDRLVVSQVEQEQKGAADPERAKNRLRTPWEVAAPIVLAQLRAPGITVSELRHHLVRRRYDGLDWSRCEGKIGEALADEIHAAPLGGVPESDPLSAELARLEGEGFGDRLEERLRPMFPEEMKEILAELPVAPPNSVVPLLPSAQHSPDFRSVAWFGTEYTFSPTQAACVKVLWEAWLNRTPSVGQDFVLETAGSESRRLADVFKGHPAWGVMIVEGATRGAYRLAGEPLSS